ncbi:MAG: LytTR family DNA-binding domain-containing protein [Saprospiraceae bacterium]|nr:LytTR family DNA-binding domain-containing protein [Saprospiraceae bacterium]
MEDETLKIAIIDDEDFARDVLRNFITADFPDVRIVGEAHGVESGLRLLTNVATDLVFLDVKMQDGTAFDLLAKIPQPNFNIIFVTAYDSFAFKAFQFNAIDYLLKPIDPDALIRAIQKYKKHYQNNQFSQRLENLMSSVSSKKLDRITLSSSEGMIFLRLEQIIRLESDGNYTSFFTSNDERIIVSKTIKEYADILPEDVFCRIHQSHIVNTNFISKFLKEDGGYTLMQDGSKLPVSRRRKEALLRLLSGKSL